MNNLSWINSYTRIEQERDQHKARVDVLETKLLARDKELETEKQEVGGGEEVVEGWYGDS